MSNLSALIAPSVAMRIYGTETNYSAATKFVIPPPTYIQQGETFGPRWPIVIKWTGGDPSYMQNTLVSGFIFHDYRENRGGGPQYTADAFVRRSEVTGGRQEAGNVPVYFKFRDGITFPDAGRFVFQVILRRPLPPPARPGEQQRFVRWSPSLTIQDGYTQEEMTLDDFPEFEVLEEEDRRPVQRKLTNTSLLLSDQVCRSNLTQF